MEYRDTLPTLSTDLVDQLDELYPERCPSKRMTDREIWMYAGQRELIRSLLVRKSNTDSLSISEGVIRVHE